jgi:hypothetical protein
MLFTQRGFCSENFMAKRNKIKLWEAVKVGSSEEVSTTTNVGRF